MMERRLPEWAPRVSQSKIRRLYETDAEGIYDEDLIDEVGYALMARCESFITACRAVQGEVTCPQCAQVLPRAEMLRCPCGWELSWADYLKTIQHRQLSGAEPVLDLFREFVNTFSSASTPQQKVFAIDCLIHGFHWYYKDNHVTRPVAVNLIEGRMHEVVAFLESLSYSNKSTQGTQANLAEWKQNIAVNAAWYTARSGLNPPKDD
jgi:hypothetical protein